MTQEELRASIESSMEAILQRIEEISGVGTKEKVKEGDTEFETEGVLQNLIEEYNFKKAILDDMDKRKTKKVIRLNRRNLQDYEV